MTQQWSRCPDGDTTVCSFSILKSCTIKYFLGSVPLEHALLQQAIPLMPLPQALGQLADCPSSEDSSSSGASWGPQQAGNRLRQSWRFRFTRTHRLSRIQPVLHKTVPHRRWEELGVCSCRQMRGVESGCSCTCCSCASPGSYGDPSKSACLPNLQASGRGSSFMAVISSYGLSIPSTQFLLCNDFILQLVQWTLKLPNLSSSPSPHHAALCGTSRTWRSNNGPTAWSNLRPSVLPHHEF